MNNTIRHDKDGGFTVMPLKEITFVNTKESISPASLILESLWRPTPEYLKDLKNSASPEEWRKMHLGEWIEESGCLTKENLKNLKTQNKLKL